ncbi:hypothetical protein K469DRAFT_558590 [Zopfia rhizophila CBS 207.26]|uniref:Helicase C-terminal domain-containing protein n=1 Tax=Zopfia rhizophila CBS 207.26 TaxID=1314779 RepID=A0A6A6EGT9_9PEZI|nr:hypothetical protein K469DRAFT_558590 [Zopfia rhizophila CBS 207.26]
MTSYSESQSESDTKLGDIKKYIALGCLRCNPSLRIDIDALSTYSEWAELMYANLAGDISTAIGSEEAKLLHAGWIRLFAHRPNISAPAGGRLVRVYLLPHDVGRRFIDRESKTLKLALRNLLHRVDVSPEAWSGNHAETEPHYFDPWASPENYSLFYLFNKLPSPAPSPEKIKSRYTRRAVEELLSSASPSAWEDYDEPLIGLKTKLYPYQARSAALMIQREAAPQLQLDPRLELRQSPNGETFYFGGKDGSFLQEPRYYETNRGGILAETMGLGKTIICLAVILATRGHIPHIPPAYQSSARIRERVAPLSDVAAATLGRHAIPGKAHLERLEYEEGINLSFCKRFLDNNVPHYEIPVEPPRMNRTTRVSPPKKLVMCNGTIIVVPRNLLHQWQAEIRKHVTKGSLKILIVDSKSKKNTRDKTLHIEEADNMEFRAELPSTTDLMLYDIVLFTRNRFEQEIQDGADEVGRRFSAGAPLVCQCPYIGASRVRDCRCMMESGIYESPLKKLHWLRIIIDEGHAFSSVDSNAVLVAKQLQAERRWVVSGTPAKDLVGVEVDLSTMDADDTDPSLVRELTVEQRKNFNAKEDRTGAAKSLGALASNFLMVRPWCDSDTEGKLEWDDYIYRHEHHFRKTYSAFSTCFLRTLEGLVVKTRPEDVEKDITLPPMKHNVVYLKPCWFDKMTANLFIQVLRANAITSERTDVDYLFHKNSLKARRSLIANLRQSNFTWTGFSLEDVASTLETSSKYLSKEDKNCSIEDANSLLESSQIISSLLQSDGWISLSKAHEVGMFVRDWPENSEESFALAYPNKPAMIGMTQLLEGQSYVDGQILSEDPSEGLNAVGQAAKAKIAAMEEAEKALKTTKKLDSGGPPFPKAGVPSSCVGGQPVTSRRASILPTKASPKKPKPPVTIPEPTDIPDGSKEADAPASPNRPKKRRLTMADETAELPEDSPLRNTRVIGTTSAKLTYLMEKVMKHQAEEKIIIFYDGDNAAFYIAQCLEILYINHRIYARTLDNKTRSKYVSLFNEDPDIRVLLIDVACGALGLNLNVASVVLIVNPINRPGIEAQAIKRAHRIGQMREVLVETLVLEGTIEEAIFNRAKKMSRNEHLHVKTLEDDDKIIDIIQNAKVIPIEPDEGKGFSQLASLETPQQIFGRPGREKYQKYGHADAGLGKGSPEKAKKRPRQGKPQKKDEDKDMLVIRRSGAVRSPNPQTPTIFSPESAVQPFKQPFQSIFGGPSASGS